MPPQRVWFLSRFGLKTGIDFEHFGLKLGMVIRGTFTKAYKLIFLPSNRGVSAKFYLFIFVTLTSVQYWCICYAYAMLNHVRLGLKMGMDFRSQVWKRVWKMAFFGLKLGLDLEMRAAHPHQKFQGVPLPGWINRGRLDRPRLWHDCWYVWQDVLQTK